MRKITKFRMRSGMMQVCINICYSKSPEYAATSSEMLPEACKNTDEADEEEVTPTQTQREGHRSNVKKTRTSTPSTSNKLVFLKIFVHFIHMFILSVESLCGILLVKHLWPYISLVS